jgi:serine protease Do
MIPGYPQRIQRDRGPRPLSLGTGFIIDKDGTLLTNYHVIRGADEIQVQFTEDPNEKPVTAQVIGTDPELDIALLKVKTKLPLTAIALGDSDQLEVGEFALAVGNPFGQGHSVTHGLISAKGRTTSELPLANYIQTSAPINPGNSGGPLVNLKGEVIGINNAIDARAQGIGFAIPINAVKKILPTLKEGGKISRGYLGVLVAPLDTQMASELGVKKGAKGAVVSQAEPGLPAFKSGIRPYDVITHINEQIIQSPSDLMGAVAATAAGKSINVKILRDGKEKEFSVKLAQRPDQFTRQ